MRILKVVMATAALLTVAAAPDPLAISASTTTGSSLQFTGCADGNALLAELNRLRSDPHAFAAELRNFRKGFAGSVHYDGPDSVGWQTEEGTAAVDEAIAVLERQPALPPVDGGTLLEEAATDHAVAQAADGSEGHVGTDGSEPGDRVRRHGGGEYVAEVIAYGSTSAADALRQLIIDDGVADRGHREVLLDPDYRFAGGRCAPHPVWGQVCVIELAPTSDGSI